MPGLRKTQPQPAKKLTITELARGHKNHLKDDVACDCLFWRI